MRSSILGFILLFTAVSGYAELKCDSPDYKDNPSMHDACVNLQKALEQKIKDKTEKFSEGINRARQRVAQGRLQAGAGNLPATPTSAGNIPGQTPAPAPAIPTLPEVTPPPAPYQPPSTPPVAEPPAPPEPAPEPAPEKTSKASPSTNKSIKYY